MPTVKDYVAFVFSALALCLSLYNFYRSRTDARTERIRTIEQKRFECVALISDVESSALRSENALSAVRFEAKRAHDAEAVKAADEAIAAEKKSFLDFSKEAQESLLRATVDGTAAELLAIERQLGSLKLLKARAAESELRTANLVAALREHLLAAADLKESAVSSVSQT